MGLIEEFIARYRREFDFYDQTARLIAQALDSNLQAAGIRSMVTSRAKSPARLEAKVRQRARTKTYATLEDVSADTEPGQEAQVDYGTGPMVLDAASGKSAPARRSDAPENAHPQSVSKF